MRKILCCLPILLASLTASAASLVQSTYAGQPLDGVALNAAAASRTATINTRRLWGKLVFTLDYTYSAATAVTVTMTCDIGGGAYGSLTARTTGTTTMYTRAVTDTVCDNDGATDAPACASATLNLEYDVRACDNVKLLVGSTAGGASDLIDGYVSLVVGQ